MPKYTYKACELEGKIVRGTAVARDERSLQALLKTEGRLLISARERRDRVKRRPLNAKQLSDFSRHIGSFTSAGVSLVRSLNILVNEESLKPEERSLYNALLRLVRQGVSLSDAMEAQGNLFPALLINMFRSAEAGGNLESTATRMADHYEKENKINSKIKTSTVYPKLLAFLLVAVLVIIEAVVLPNFKPLFDEMQTLPAATTVLMSLSDFIVARWYVILVSVTLAILILRILMTIPVVKYYRDMLIIRMPLIGKLQKAVLTARFARTLSSLYVSGIPIVQCLQIGRKTVNNTYIDSQFDAVISAVRAGGTLSDAIGSIDGFVQKLSSVIRAGEETGSLDYTLDSIAETLDYESEAAIERMVSYIEPAMIILMGIIVGFVIVAVILPVYQYYEVVSEYSASY